MKKVILFFAVFSIPCFLFSQTISERYADSVSKRMRDSLDLKKDQADSLRRINLNYCEQHLQVIKEFRGSPELISELQKVENTRDSLTEAVIGEEKYTRYRFRKSEMISNKGRR